jgi:hypothetical protein
VVATEGLTCLVFAPAAPTLFAGRGEGARLPGPAPASPGQYGAGAGQTHVAPGDLEILEVLGVGAQVATARLDVTDQIDAKVAALCAYRSQFPLEPGMFPDFLLSELFGREYFIQVLPPRQVETELL